MSSVTELLEKAAQDPNLTLEQAATALLRYTIMRCIEGTADVSDVARALASAAKMRSASPEVGGEGELEAFFGRRG